MIYYRQNEKFEKYNIIIIPNAIRNDIFVAISHADRNEFRIL